jgi:hypothetical protein
MKTHEAAYAKCLDGRCSVDNVGSHLMRAQWCQEHRQTHGARVPELSCHCSDQLAAGPSVFLVVSVKNRYCDDWAGCTLGGVGSGWGHSAVMEEAPEGAG